MSSTQEVGDIFGQGSGSAQAMLRSPTVLILCVGLWGMNLFFYRLFGLDYKYILNYDLIEIEKEEKAKAEALANYNNNNNNNNDSRGSTRWRSRDNSGYPDTSTNDSDNDLELMETTTTSVTTSSGLGSSKKGKSSLPNSPAGMKPLPIQIGKAKSSPLVSGSTVFPMSPMSPMVPDIPLLSSLTQPSLSSMGDVFGPSAIVWYKLLLFSVVLLMLLHFSTHYWMDHLHRSSIGAVFFFYLSVLVYIFVPLRQNSWLRRSFGIVLRRIWALVHPRCSCITLAGTTIPPRRIPFVDVFFADAMCSLSKVFFDWGMLAHQAVHYPHAVPAATHNIVIPSLCAALPYLIRARQCLIMHTVGKLKRDPHKHHHLMNAFKYSTSMYPLILSAYLKTFSAKDDHSNVANLETLLTFLSFVNASYSLYWDIVMDWGMMQDPYRVAQTACAMGVVPPVVEITNNSHLHAHSHSSSKKSTCLSVFLRPSLRFGLTLTVLIVVADSFLRFSWALKFVPRLFPSPDAFVLCTQFLEVFRRGIWNLLRVEWENIKQQKHNNKNQSGSNNSNNNISGSNNTSDLQPMAQQQGLLGNSSQEHSSGSDQEDPKESSVEMKMLR